MRRRSSEIRLSVHDCFFVQGIFIDFVTKATIFNNPVLYMQSSGTKSPPEN